MDEDDLVAQFVGITESSADRAQQYLRLSDGNIEQAVELYFSTGGVDLEGPPSSLTQTSVPPPEPASLSSGQSTERQARTSVGGVVNIDSDDEKTDNDEVVITGTRSRHGGGVAIPANRLPASGTPPGLQPSYLEDEDAAMARRMQEEIYAGGDMGRVIDTEGYRAPMARTTETLVGPESYDLTDREDIRAAVEEQMRARRGYRPRGRGGAGVSGIFNQRPGSSSIWNQDGSPITLGHGQSNRASAGPSDKHTLLAEMYRPPFDLMSRLSWEEARTEGKENEKWILVDVQDPAIFDCQVLNRDLWKNASIKETVRENFIFMQFSKDDPKASQYLQYYFQNRENQDAYPHIAIVDPRTGEQVKVWSGPPAPKPDDFLVELYEFLDRYSLKVTAKNPVARRKPEGRKAKEVEKMTEEEMLEMAMQNSLAGTSRPEKEDADPDALTRSMTADPKGKGKGKAAAADADNDTDMTDLDAAPTNGHHADFDSDPSPSPFASISASHPHTEPPADAASTRIQFRHSGGRVVRRFLLADPVRRIYEWLKASPLDGTAGLDFALVAMGTNLIDSLDVSVERAGLKNGTVMVEVVEG
ncbi:hypothetical protein MMC26_001355 [Xylographa opegraphella]|nr:hypothetical protein [Xylographa opegraphella]